MTLELQQAERRRATLALRNANNAVGSAETVEERDAWARAAVVARAILAELARSAREQAA